MRRRSRALKGGRFAWLAFAVVTLVLASPLKLAWARPALGWTFPFILWLFIIGISVWEARAGRGDPDDD